MQFYEDGFDFDTRRWTYCLPQDGQGRKTITDDLPDELDVLIVGTGPAGLLLAAQLARFPSIKTRIIDSKPGRLHLGQADGLQCRSLEIFEAFKFSERVLREGYFVNETTFWSPDGDKKLIRTGRTKDTKLGLSEFPHIILNQARVLDFFLDDMYKSPTTLRPTWSTSLIDLQTNEGINLATVQTSLLDGRQETRKVKARYVVGCDGGRSSVRKAIGLSLKGDSANQAWGVMDVLADTDFPDIRFKCAIKSKENGTILCIPREGGYLVRLYVELDHLDPNERVASRHITFDRLVEQAQKIFHPFYLTVKECIWWSVYEIGQRLADHFDNRTDTAEPTVFIAGDACHTHSPKAGQGMNVSMADCFNLGWKLVQVLEGTADSSLLQTYSNERHTVAKELIDFDREWARTLGSHGKQQAPAAGGKTAVQEAFEKSARFTAGLSNKYEPSSIISPPSTCHQDLATGFDLGQRFHSSIVLRCFDARPIHLGHQMPADARWRILIFGASHSPTDHASPVGTLCDWLSNDKASPVVRYTPQDTRVDSLIDVKLITRYDHTEIDFNGLPELLKPRKGRYGLRDYEKVFSDHWKDGEHIESIYEERSVDSTEGCVVICRPDQHVSTILRLTEHTEIARFFDGFMRRPS